MKTTGNLTGVHKMNYGQSLKQYQWGLSFVTTLDVKWSVKTGDFVTLVQVQLSVGATLQANHNNCVSTACGHVHSCYFADEINSIQSISPV